MAYGETSAAAHKWKKVLRLISLVPFVQLRKVDSARSIFSATWAKVKPLMRQASLNRWPQPSHFLSRFMNAG
jgi:hypothetical protein